MLPIIDDLTDFNRWMHGEIEYDSLTGRSKAEADVYLEEYYRYTDTLCDPRFGV